MSDKHDEMARDIHYDEVAREILETAMMGEYSQAADKIASALRQVERETLERVLERMTRWAKYLATRQEARLPDHACVECVPWSDMIVPGFRCSLHDALAFLDERALSPTPTEDVPTPTELADGYVRVPREASEEMIKAGIEQMPVIVRHSRDHNGWHAQPIYRGDPGWVCPSEVYRAMIQAAEKGE